MCPVQGAWVRLCLPGCWNILQSHGRKEVEPLACHLVWRQWTDPDSYVHSYLARLEHRIQDIEASLRRLEQNQSNGPSSPVHSSHSEVDAPSIPPDHRITLPTPPTSDLPGRSNAISQGRAEFGEIDVSENAIDGMGAINFTDEEDCGFFGMSLREPQHLHVQDRLY